MIYSMQGISRLVVIGSWGFIIGIALLCLINLLELGVFGQGQIGSLPLLTEDALGLLGLAAVLAMIFSYVVGAVFCYRASANARALDPNPGRITPGWAVAWWPIPIANLWMPFKAVKQVWNSSHGRHMAHAAPGYMSLWWAAWVTGEIIGNISWRISIDADVYSSSYQNALWLDVVNTPINIAAGILWIRIVREIARAQRDGQGTARVFE